MGDGMFARSQDEIDKLYTQVEGVKRLSDKIISIGPVPIIGLDGILSFVPIPGIGLAYSVIAAISILILGLRARCDLLTLLTAFLVLLANAAPEMFQTVGELIPFINLIALPAGAAASTLFMGHLYAAKLIQGDIRRTLYIDDSALESLRSGRHNDYKSHMRSLKGKSRLVYFRA